MARRRKEAEEGHAAADAVAIETDGLQQEIELRAYYRYCERGCAPGDDVNDWLSAEQEVLAKRAEERR